jgi:hypothetical protein
LLLLAGTAVGCATTPSSDYRFDVVHQPVKVGRNSEIAIRLVHLPSGQVVKDAIIARSELAILMLRPAHKTTPTGLKEVPMEQEVEFWGADGQGNYLFRGNVSMSGTWTLDLAARVPGEVSTVRGAVRFKAVS